MYIQSNSVSKNYKLLYIAVFDWKLKPFIKIGISSNKEYKRLYSIQQHLNIKLNFEETLIFKCDASSVITDVENYLKLELEGTELTQIEYTNLNKENTIGFTEMFDYSQYQHIVHLAKTYFDQFGWEYKIMSGKEIEGKITTFNKVRRPIVNIQTQPIAYNYLQCLFNSY
jgi:hypothetical protein